MKESKVYPLTFSPKHHFFGYYGKCPWSGDGKRVLSMEVDFIDRMPSGLDSADIGIVSLEDNSMFKRVASTKAWNWQQGCMLQWLPPDYDKKIIFNDFRGGKFVSIILNLETKEEKILSMPIYDVHPNGKYAISLNFSRLEKVREGYGYRGVIYKNEEIAPNDDGIFLLDLASGISRLIISFKDLVNFKHLDLMDQGFHWVDHLTFSPDGSRFAFFHRFLLKDGRFYERLITANWDGSDKFVLLDTGMASHFTWRGNNQVLAWGRLPNMVVGLSRKNNLLRFIAPIYRGLGLRKLIKGFFRERVLGDGFLLLTDKSDSIKRVGVGVLENGHPSFLPDQEIIITDTYASKDHIRKLILYNISSGEQKVLGDFYSLPNLVYSQDLDWDSSAMRADLHPRLNRTSTEVCFDSVHEGSRQIYGVDIRGQL
jgi:hypothetical protein